MGISIINKRKLTCDKRLLIIHEQPPNFEKATVSTRIKFGEYYSNLSARFEIKHLRPVIFQIKNSNEAFVRGNTICLIIILGYGIKFFSTMEHPKIIPVRGGGEQLFKPY